MDYYGVKYSRIDQVKLVEDSHKKIEVICCAKADYITSNFLKAIFHKLYLVHSWILGPILKLQKQRDNNSKIVYWWKNSFKSIWKLDSLTWTCFCIALTLINKFSIAVITTIFRKWFITKSISALFPWATSMWARSNFWPITESSVNWSSLY